MFILTLYSQALTNAVRELLDKSRSEKASNKGPIEFAENPQLPAEIAGAESQSSSNMESGLNVVGENVNEDERHGVGVRAEKTVTGQDLEECNHEFLIIERQF